MTDTDLILRVNRVCLFRAILAGIFLLLVASGCGQKKGPPEVKEEESPPPVVEVTHPERRDLEEKVEATANLVASRQVRVLSRAQGRVVSLSHEVGDEVSLDEVLVTLSNPESMLSTQGVRHRLERAQAELERLLPLLERGFIPRAEVDRAEAEVALLRDELKLAQQSQEELLIRAPLTGVVAERLVQEGDLVSPGQPLFLIVNPNALEAELRVPEKALGRLSEGQRARFLSPSFPGARFAGRVKLISPTIDPISGTVGVKVEVLELEQQIDGQSWKLRPGMFVEVEVIAAMRQGVVMVPRRAVVREGQHAKVFVVREGMAEPIEVSLGLSEAGMVEIEGLLDENDEVIVLGQAGLKRDSEVRVVGKPTKELEGETH